MHAISPGSYRRFRTSSRNAFSGSIPQPKHHSKNSAMSKLTRPCLGEGKIGMVRYVRKEIERRSCMPALAPVLPELRSDIYLVAVLADHVDDLTMNPLKLRFIDFEVTAMRN